jgi:hypothetical protein
MLLLVMVCIPATAHAQGRKSLPADSSIRSPTWTIVAPGQPGIELQLREHFSSGDYAALMRFEPGVDREAKIAILDSELSPELLWNALEMATQMRARHPEPFSRRVRGSIRQGTPLGALTPRQRGQMTGLILRLRAAESVHIVGVADARVVRVSAHP